MGRRVRLTISVDSISHQIDSTDPELLGRWMLEIFARAAAYGISDATYIQAYAYPSWVPDSSATGGGKPDWIADTRIIGSTFLVKSPRELVEALSRQLDEAEELAAAHE